uniref:4-coumarate--CoA ligase n=1 Tax=Leersia perrieri TaxID=77586 RepID=A0A0D9X432_9ORYZ
MAQHCRGHIAHCLGGALAGRDTVAVSGRCRLTGPGLADGVRGLAAGLSELGVRPGHVVAVVAFNSVEYIELFLAITYIGAIIAPLNYRWSFEEASHAVDLVRPSVFIIDDSFRSWALRLMKSKSLTSINLYLIMGDPCSTSQAANFVSIEQIKRSSGGTRAAEPVSAPNDVALICFTSGTTGQPKGVAISHTSLIIQSLAKIAIVGYGEDDVYMHTAPLCHIGGISSCMAILMAGGCHVLLPKFDAKSALDAILEHRVTSFITVPAIMADLLSYARKEKISGHGITVTKILNGGGGLTSELISGASYLFPHATIFSAYGMTEACSSLTFMVLNRPKLQQPNDQLGYYAGGVCVGRPAPHIEIRIDRDGRNSSSSPVGNILTRGLHTMSGYWVNNSIDISGPIKNGWLDTGDTGWVDKTGNLWLMGRQKGRIKTGGENVYPEEVESVLSQHPGVAKAVVIGLPDSRLGEKVVACVSIRDGWKWVDAGAEHMGEGREVSAHVLQDHCRMKKLSRCSTKFRNAERREAAAAVDVAEGGGAEVEPLHAWIGPGPRQAAGERGVLLTRDAPGERWRVLRLPRDAADERWRVFTAAKGAVFVGGGFALRAGEAGSGNWKLSCHVRCNLVDSSEKKVIEKDPNKAVPLFWAAINSGDRIESALKDMATVLKQANRSEEAIEAIRSFRDRCPNEAQESIDNILLDLYKKCGRTKEQIEMLTVRLRIVDEELASGRWKTKMSKSHGRVVYLSLRDEKARLLGNLAWAYMQSENYDEAEMLYRQALAIEADYNKECNLAICLIKTGKVAEAKYLLQAIPDNCSDESHLRSLARATEMLMELESPTLPSPITQMKSKESLIWLASDVENLEHLQPRTLSTPLTQLKSEEPHISVAADAEKHEDCNSQVFPSPITQMKREEPQIVIATSEEKNEECLSKYQDLSRLFNDAATPQSLLEKLRKRLVKEDKPNISMQRQVQIPSFNTCSQNCDGATDASENIRQQEKALVDGVGKTWADMVEEDEHQLDNVASTICMDSTEQNVSSKHANEKMYRTPSSSQGSNTLQRSSVGNHLQSSSAGSWRRSDSKIFACENSKFVRTAPAWRQHKVEDYSNRVSQRLDTVRLSEKAQGTEQSPWRSSTAQRSLFPEWKSKCERYGHGYVPFGDNAHFQGSSQSEAAHRWPKNVTNGRPWRQQNRLRVFQEITNEINQKVV